MNSQMSGPISAWMHAGKTSGLYITVKSFTHALILLNLEKKAKRILPGFSRYSSPVKYVDGDSKSYYYNTE